MHTRYTPATKDCCCSKITIDHRPLQLAFLSCSSTSGKLLSHSGLDACKNSCNYFFAVFGKMQSSPFFGHTHAITAATKDCYCSKITIDHRPLQLASLSCSSTSGRLLKVRARMTFLLIGALAMFSSSVSMTLLPMPNATTFIHVPPTAKGFIFSASTYIRAFVDEI